MDAVSAARARATEIAQQCAALPKLIRTALPATIAAAVPATAAGRIHEKAPPAGGAKGLILMQWGCPDVRNPTPIKYQIGCTARGRLAFKENKV